MTSNILLNIEYYAVRDIRLLLLFKSVKEANGFIENSSTISIIVLSIQLKGHWIFSIKIVFDENINTPLLKDIFREIMLKLRSYYKLAML